MDAANRARLVGLSETSASLFVARGESARFRGEGAGFVAVVRRALFDVDECGVDLFAFLDGESNSSSSSDEECASDVSVFRRAL